MELARALACDWKSKLLIQCGLQKNLSGLGTLQVWQRKADPIPSYRQFSNPRFLPAVWVGDLTRPSTTSWTLILRCRPFQGLKNAPGRFQQLEHWPLHAALFCRRRSRQKSLSRTIANIPRTVKQELVHLDKPSLRRCSFSNTYLSDRFTAGVRVILCRASPRKSLPAGRGDSLPHHAPAP